MRCEFRGGVSVFSPGPTPSRSLSFKYDTQRNLSSNQIKKKKTSSQSLATTISDECRSYCFHPRLFPPLAVAVRCTASLRVTTGKLRLLQWTVLPGSQVSLSAAGSFRGQTHQVAWDEDRQTVRQTGRGSRLYVWRRERASRSVGGSENKWLYEAKTLFLFHYR